MPLAVPDRTLAGELLVALGVLGALASVAATVVGVRFLGELGDALDDSVGVTASAVDALRASVDVGAETLGAVERVLDETEATTRELTVALRATETALGDVAQLSEEELADGLVAVSRSLPALIDAAAVIDRTLSGLSAVPFGPSYDPVEPFDDSLRGVQAELDDLPSALRDQAARIRAGRDSLREVRRGTSRVADDLQTLNATLASASALLDGYDTAAEEAAAVVDGSSDALRRHLTLGRALLVVLGTVLLASQAVPLGLGWALLRPASAAAFLAGVPPAEVTAAPASNVPSGPTTDAPSRRPEDDP